MKIAYNPTTAAALSSAPNNIDVVFDLKGLNIFAKGIKFQGTDDKVLQSATTTSNYRPLILGYQNSTDVNSLANSTTNQVYATTKLYAQPSTGYLWAQKLYSGGKEVLTSHQSLSNYVTINTAQTITGQKTFSSPVTATKFIGPLQGNADTATKLQTTRRIWGQPFDGTKDVTGVMTINPPTITSGSDNTIMFQVYSSTGYKNGLAVSSIDNITRLYAKPFGSGTKNALEIHTYNNTDVNAVIIDATGNVGIGTTSPAQKLHISGNVLANGFMKSGSSDSYVLLGGGGHLALSSLNSSHNHDDRYVNVSGDTMTGKLTISTSTYGEQLEIKRSISGGDSTIGYSNSDGFLGTIGIGGSNSPVSPKDIIFKNYKNDQYKVWHVGNDGSGSGLDADMLDGVHLNGIFTGFSYAQSKLSATIGTVSKTVNVTGSYPSISNVTMNTIASYGNCMGMADLASSNSNVNPNNQTSWHHFINMSYNTESTNMWQTQFAIKAGTTEVWVRSRAGGSVSDSSAWAAPWVRLARITDNVASATKLQTARTIWGQSFNGTANVTGNMSSVGSINMSGDILISQASTTGTRQIRFTCGDNDYGRIAAGANASNAGWLEIATADDANEPIYVRQYSGVFTTLKRTLTLLDGSGNTSLPGYITSVGFKKSGSSDSYVLLGGGGHKAVSDFATASSLNNYVTLTTAQTISGVKTFSTQQKFTVGNGTAPFTVSSNTLVTNLNADLLDGQHSSYFLTKAGVNNNGGTMYVTNDTHIMQLGYMTCSSSYDSLTLQFQSAFWGNQHGSSDIIWLCQDLNTNGAQTVHVSACRLKIGYHNSSRTFYYKIDSTNKRVYLYVYVTGGNSYGRWISQIISSSNPNMWVSEIKFNQPNTGLTTIQERFEFESVYSATRLLTARKINGTSFDGTSDITTAYWGTTRTISLTGAITGSVSTNGGSNITINTTYGTGNITNLDNRYVKKAGDTMQGNLAFASGKQTRWTAHGISYITDGNVDSGTSLGGDLANLVISSWYGVSFTTSCSGQTYTNKTAVGINCRTGIVYAANFVGPLQGNASTATQLQTARTINGTSFNGTANIVTSYWGTSRTLTIGNTGKSVNGSGNVSWSLSEIGAAAVNHTHNSMVSKGNLNPQTGRTQSLGDVYSYNTVSGNTGAPTTYTSVIGFGRGTYGTVEIAGGWTSSMGLWYRSLRDTTDSWYSWRPIIDSVNYTNYIKKIGTSTIGNSSTPIYLNGGTPTPCAGITIKYWAIYSLIDNGSNSKKAGNYNFISSSSRRNSGRYIINVSFPSGYNDNNTIIIGQGRLNTDKPVDPILYVTIVHFTGNTYQVNTADDASYNDGSCDIIFLCF